MNLFVTFSHFSVSFSFSVLTIFILRPVVGAEAFEEFLFFKHFIPLLDSNINPLVKHLQWNYHFITRRREVCLDVKLKRFSQRPERSTIGLF